MTVGKLIAVQPHLAARLDRINTRRQLIGRELRPLLPVFVILQQRRAHQSTELAGPAEQIRPCLRLAVGPNNPHRLPLSREPTVRSRPSDAESRCLAAHRYSRLWCTGGYPLRVGES